MPTKVLPSAEYLRECFDYDPDSGSFRWKVRPREHFKTGQKHREWNTRWSGRDVGRPNKYGHIHLTVNAVALSAHRVIWVLQTGKWPDKIDHKNGDPADNRWENLREATVQQNRWNARHTGKLPRGVRRARSGGRFWSQACILKPDGGRSIRHLGTFDTPAQAHAAWCAFMRGQRGEFFRAG